MMDATGVGKTQPRLEACPVSQAGMLYVSMEQSPQIVLVSLWCANLLAGSLYSWQLLR